MVTPVLYADSYFPSDKVIKESKYFHRVKLSENEAEEIIKEPLVFHDPVGDRLFFFVRSDFLIWFFDFLSREGTDKIRDSVLPQKLLQDIDSGRTALVILFFHYAGVGKVKIIKSALENRKLKATFKHSRRYDGTRVDEVNYETHKWPRSEKPDIDWVHQHRVPRIYYLNPNAFDADITSPAFFVREYEFWMEEERRVDPTTLWARIKTRDVLKVDVDIGRPFETLGGVIFSPRKD